MISKKNPEPNFFSPGSADYDIVRHCFFFFPFFFFGVFVFLFLLEANSILKKKKKDIKTDAPWKNPTVTVAE